METKSIYFKSDFTLIESCDAGYSTPFRFYYYTASKSRAFVASYDGETYTNCSLSDDGMSLTVAIDNHKLGLGTLMVEREYYLTNEDFADGICNEYISPTAVDAYYEQAVTKTITPTYLSGGYIAAPVSSGTAKVYSSGLLAKGYELFEPISVKEGDVIKMYQVVQPYYDIRIYSCDETIEAGSVLTFLAIATQDLTYTVLEDGYVTFQCSGGKSEIPDVHQQTTDDVDYNIILALEGDKTIDAKCIVPSYYQKGDKGDDGTIVTVTPETTTGTLVATITTDGEEHKIYAPGGGDGKVNDVQTSDGTSVLNEDTGIATLPTIPTKTSELTNDSVFATTTDLDTKVDKVDGKGLSTNDFDATAKGITDKFFVSGLVLNDASKTVTGNSDAISAAFNAMQNGMTLLLHCNMSGCYIVTNPCSSSGSGVRFGFVHNNIEYVVSINFGQSIKMESVRDLTQIDTNTSAIGTLSSLTTTAKTDLVSAVNEVDGDLGDLALQISEKADKISVVEETETTVASLTPNILHKWGEVESLTITGFEAGEDGKYTEYMIEFVSGETATTLSLPDTITWMGGSAPTIAASRTYQISIVNNLAVIGEF